MNLENLKKIKENTVADAYLDDSRKGTRVVIGMATCGIAAGASPVLAYFTSAAKGDASIKVCTTGCIGTCRLEPIVEVYRPGEGRTTYVLVDQKKAERIFQEHIKGGKIVQEYTVGAAEGEKARSIDEISFFKRQKRVVLQNCGIINPEDINEYISTGGYQALEKVLGSMSRMDVIDVLLEAGLRGRGGAGFPTGLKWKLTMDEPNPKYVVCNADEGDPGAFMNRAVLEGDPHAVLEAMAIAGYTTGANKGYIYVRAEYPIAVKRLDIAIEQARELGLLGDNIMGSGFDFDIELRLGAGAFVCGEETALLASIEGKRGEPRPKPPFPSQSGAFDRPSVINNVGTFANVPKIILNGPEWFSAMGTEKSKGTKEFALGGKIRNTGLIEVEMGTTLREIIYDIGGGIPDDKAFKAAQTGGPSGGCIPAQYLDTPLDYESLAKIGSMMGSGGLIVMDEDNCMVDVARFFLDFTVDESCGKCVPCRIGTRRLLDMLEQIVSGNGKPGDIEKLEELCMTIKRTALCGLGQSAPNPVLSTLRYFRDEYEVHINDTKCPAKHCKKLVSFVIDKDKCIGCGLCAKSCPVDAIAGERKQPYNIAQDKCIKCGMCYNNCRFNAIVRQ